MKGWRRSDTPSIRARLAWALVAWALAWGLSVGAAVWLVAENEVAELLDDRLKASGELVATIVAAAPEPSLAAAAGNAQATVAAPNAGSDERFAWQVVGTDGALLMRSAAAPAEAWHRTATSGFTMDRDWRVYGMALAADGRMLYAGQTLDERHEATVEVALSAALAALAVGLLGHVWLRSRVRSELRPLITLSDRLERLGVDDPHSSAAARSLGAAERAELRPIHKAIEALTARLSARIANERAFSEHAAHALRTPLAGIDAQLAVALRECPATMVDRLQRVRDASRRLQGVVAALLGIFRSGLELERRPIDLQQLAAHLPVAGIEVHVSAGACLDGDADLLAAALVNLLDNAERHGASAIWLEAPGPRLLRVHDDGPGAPPGRRADLQQALDDQSYAGATGLGLMLSDRVARAHGGRLRLLDDAPGFALEIDLGSDVPSPATPPAQPQGPGNTSPM